MRFGTLSIPRGLLAALIACFAFGARSGAQTLPSSPLPDYWEESGFIVDAPGASNHLAAGLFNPAAWSVRPTGGLLLGWDQPIGAPDASDVVPGEENWITVLSMRSLAFGMRGFHFSDADGDCHRWTDYTVGLGGGSHGGGFGAAYSWSSGTGSGRRANRLIGGAIARWRPLSVGLSGMYALENRRDHGDDARDYFMQGDIGLRPLGPRLTIFGEAVWSEHEEPEDIRTGYGIEIHPWRGLVIGAEAQSTGEFGVRLGIGLAPRFRPSASLRFADADDDGRHIESTYMFETQSPAPDLGILRHRSPIPEMDLKGPIAYRRYQLFDDRRTLLGTLAQIDRYATDPKVEGVVINLSGLSTDVEKLWELRQQLAGLRAAGKRVVVYFDETGMSGLLLASVADQIWMDSRGLLDIRGLAGGRTYLRGTLEKLGLGFEEWRFFTFKSAYETFSHRSLSEADSIQFSALLDDYYETFADAITESRRISRADWDRLIDEKGILLPREAQEAGLIDSIGAYDDATKAARKAAPRQSPDSHATVLGDLLGDPVWGPLEWGQRPRIALLYAIGPTEMDDGIAARRLSKEIKKARENKQVAAVVLRADSPGGSALASDLVAREMLATAKKKPMIVTQGAVAGSGGYWISMYGDTIVSSPFSLTGSIGVIGGWFWNAGLGDKLGITWDGLWRGRHADLGRGLEVPILGMQVPERNLTSEERARMEFMIRQAYSEFVAKVAGGRGLSETDVDKIGQGRIWSGLSAQKIGLVDELGGMWQGLRLAKAAARIPAHRPVEISEGPRIGVLDLGFLQPKLLGLFGKSRGAEPISSGAWACGGYPLTTAGGGFVSPGEIAYLEAILRARGGPVFMMEPVRVGPAGD